MKSAAEPLSEIPDKVFFRIGEVGQLTELKPYVLRYWETEFAVLRPKKSRSGQRLYRRCDIDTVLEIKSLLRDRRFTIPGARAELLRLRRARSQDQGEDETVRLDGDFEAAELGVAEEPPVAAPDAELLDRVERQRDALQSVRESLLELHAEVRAFRTQR